MMKNIVKMIYTLATFILIFLLVTYLKSDTKDKTNELNLFVWGDFFHEEAIQQFEKEYNTKVNLNHYSSNEELITKLQRTKGDGFDLIFPSDYAIRTLKKKKLLQPLDKKSLSFINLIDERLLNQKYDPDNQYSLPYLWETYGIGLNTKQIPLNSIKASLSTILLNEKNHKLAMTPDPIEAFSIASFFLFGKKDALTEKEITQVFDLLKSQKKSTIAYADYRGKHLLVSGNCDIIFTRSSFIALMESCSSDLAFILPKDAVFASIENVAIPISNRKKELTYQFINFIFQPQIHAKQVELGLTFPSIQEAITYSRGLTEDYYQLLFSSLEPTQYLFFCPHTSEIELRKGWAELKSK